MNPIAKILTKPERVENLWQESPLNGVKFLLDVYFDG